MLGADRMAFWAFVLIGRASALSSCESPHGLLLSITGLLRMVFRGLATDHCSWCKVERYACRSVSAYLFPQSPVLKLYGSRCVIACLEPVRSE